MGILIKNGEIVTSVNRFKSDIYIGNNKITAIGKKLTKSAKDTVIDADGQYVFPGGVDVHTHLDMPFMGTSSSDDFESGTIAAVCGGTTSIIDFVMPEKGQSLLDALSIWQKKAKGKAVIDYGFHIAIVDWNEKIEKEIPKIIEKGITSLKVFMAYKGVLQISDSQLRNAMSEIKKCGGLTLIHAEDGDAIFDLQEKFIKEGKTQPKYHELSRPSDLEKSATARAIDIAQITKAPIYIVHLSSKSALEEIKRVRLKNSPIFTETCPQYLILTKGKYEKSGFNGAKYVMSPPLRSKEDNEALWQGLANGFIQIVSTDHCPFSFKDQKVLGKNDFRKIPNGCPGIEDRLKLMYTYGVLENRITLNKFVEVTSTNPAKFFGMYPQKGIIAIGSDGDLTIFDPKIESKFSVKNSHHRCDYNTYEGFKYKGAPTVVIVKGKIAYKDGKFCGEIGSGQFVKRAKFRCN